MDQLPDSTVDNDPVSPGDSPEEGRVAPKLFLKALPGGTFQSSPCSSHTIASSTSSSAAGAVGGSASSSSTGSSKPPPLVSRPSPSKSSPIVSTTTSIGSGNPAAAATTSAYLPRARFLNMGNRNFIKPNKKTLPGLTPISSMNSAPGPSSSSSSPLVGRSDVKIYTASSSEGVPMPTAKIIKTSSTTAGESSRGKMVSTNQPPVPKVRLQLTHPSPSTEPQSKDSASPSVKLTTKPLIIPRSAILPESVKFPKVSKENPPKVISVRSENFHFFQTPIIITPSMLSNEDEDEDDANPRETSLPSSTTTDSNVSSSGGHKAVPTFKLPPRVKPTMSEGAGNNAATSSASEPGDRLKTMLDNLLSNSSLSIPGGISISPVMSPSQHLQQGRPTAFIRKKGPPGPPLPGHPQFGKVDKRGESGGVVRPIKIPTSRFPSKAALQAQIKRGFESAAMSVQGIGEKGPYLGGQVAATMSTTPRAVVPSAAAGSSSSNGGDQPEAKRFKRGPLPTPPGGESSSLSEEMAKYDAKYDLKIPKVVITNQSVRIVRRKEDSGDEEDEDDDGDDDGDDTEGNQESPRPSKPDTTGEGDTDDKLGDGTPDGDGSARRTGRRRKPTKHFMTDFVPTRRRRVEMMGDDATTPGGGGGGEDAAITSSDGPVVRTRGRPRGSGRGRGRPRGSTLKAKLEREAMNFLQSVDNASSSAQFANQLPDSSPPPRGSENEDDGKGGQDMTTPGSFSPQPSLSGSGSSTTTPTKTRGRGRGRGTGGSAGRGTPLTPRGARRGGRGSRGPRGAARNILLATRRALKMSETEVKVEAESKLDAFEDETRMGGADDAAVDVTTLETGGGDSVAAATVSSSGAIDDQPSTPVLVTSSGICGMDEEVSNLSSTSQSASASVTKKKFSKDFIDERKPVTVETLFEYKWPQETPDGEYFFLQEQIIEFLGHKSFRRKYPNLRRRPVEMVERDFLREKKIVSETQCDLGLTAINSSEVLDILYNDFPKKYEEYRKFEEERREKELTKNQASTTANSTTTTRDRSAEFMNRITKSCAKWNAMMNAQRNENRTQSYDLQTMTLNVRQGKMKVVRPEATKLGYYPVPVLPGQYCDNYKSYTPVELKYLPLNTVIYGPIQENRTTDEVSEDGASDSNGSSSSGDDSSSSSSEDEGSDTEVNKTISDSIPVLNEKDTQGTCKSCNGTYAKNKLGRNEILIHCAKCDSANHPTCLELTLDMLPYIRKYDWQCTDCKNCIECNDPADEDKMLFCDCCDRGYHIYCVGLRRVPTGRWHCVTCSVCHSCGVNEPSADDRAAEWQHEYKKGEKGSRYYLHSLCVPCHKIYKKGQFCPNCLKCHLKLDDKNLMECRSCDKWVHKHCVKKPLQTKFGFLCDSCETSNFTMRTKLPPTNRRN
ncbi:uncharacterized protein LOC110850805 [Folsomia candida]|nr:uncharacterized protein LOC110850805 [Folsomia candida]